MKAFDKIPTCVEARLVTNEEILTLKRELHKTENLLLCNTTVRTDTAEYKKGYADGLKKSLQIINASENT